jgi:hypothetical protein
MDHMEVCEEGRGVRNAGYVAQLSIESRDGQGMWMLRPLSSRGSGDSSRVAGSAVVQAVELHCGPSRADTGRGPITLSPARNVIISNSRTKGTVSYTDRDFTAVTVTVALYPLECDGHKNNTFEDPPP